MTQESQHTEWKERWRDEHLKWICAFANTEGGTLHIGRDDKGHVVGLDKPKKRLEDLPNKTRDPLGTLKTLLAEHPSNSYNPAIANAFFRSGEIETWGRGIQRIFATCTSEGTPKPVVSYQGNDLWIEFPYAKSYLQTISNTHNENEKLDERLDEKVDEKVGERVGETLTPNRQQILRAMLENPKVSQKTLSDILGIASKNVESNIKFLKENKWIRRVGPAKGGHWEVLKR